MSYEHQCYDQRLRIRKLWLNLSTLCAIYDALGINSLIHKMQIISVLTPFSVVMSLGSLDNKKTSCFALQNLSYITDVSMN